MSHQKATEAFHDALLEDDPVQLYERAPCGYLSTTPDGRIVKANATFLTWTGYSLDELRAMSFVDLLTTGGRIYHETHYAPMLRLQGSVREIAVDIRRKRGDRLHVLVNATLDRSPDGTPRVVRIAVFDATERRQYELELLRAKERAEASEARARALARTLQQTLIPPAPPAIPGLDVSAAYHPAGDGSIVGGDFYDVFRVVGDDWVIVLGDVCGKGPEAAVVTAMVRYTIRALSAQHRSPARVLHHLNDALLEHGSGRFCTAALLRLHRAAEGWHVVYSSGGHPPPLWLAPGGEVRMVEIFGPLVGVFPGQTYDDHPLGLAPGHTLMLYTDGVTEARGEESFFGEERLLQAVSDLPRDAAAVAHGLLGRVLDFQHGTARDDIAVLAVGIPAVDG